MARLVTSFAASVLAPVARSSAFALALLGAGSSAHAGICLSDEENNEYVEQLEKFARGKAPAPDTTWALCSAGSAKLRARVVTACKGVIKGFEPRRKLEGLSEQETQRFRNQAQCVLALAHAKVAEASGVDVVAALLASSKWELFQEQGDKLEALVHSGDPRALPFFREKLRQHLDTVAGKPLKGWKANAWFYWQRSGLYALRELGDASDLPLVEELGKAGKDKRLPKLVAKAQAAIAARAGTR
jgi:hypothetical protein